MAQINLTSKTSRAALTPRRQPYFVRVAAGCFLGYRRSGAADSDGTWIGRKRDPSTGKQVHNSLGAFEEYDDAVRAANEWFGAAVSAAASRKITVEDVARRYVENRLAIKGKRAYNDATERFNRLVYGKPIARIELYKLKPALVRDWLYAQVPKIGEAEPDKIRSAKDSANRSLASLKAALNMAYRDGLCSSDTGWRGVQKFKAVAKKRDGYLTHEQRTKLFAELSGPAALYFRGLLLTAARPGELANAKVSDFNKEHGTLALDGKTGPRIVTLSNAAIELFTLVTKDRIAAAPLIQTETGKRFYPHKWKTAITEAAKRAELPPGVCAYSMRHCAISEQIMAGMSSFVVAKLAGTSTRMIDANYGHITVNRARELLNAVNML